MEVQIKDLRKIDWDVIFPAEDIILWDKRKWKFSDIPGHFPGAAGPVLETLDKPIRFYDILTLQELSFYEFDDDFLVDNAEGKVEFLLPTSWTEDQILKWFDQYKLDRSSQENVRNEMLGNI